MKNVCILGISGSVGSKTYEVVKAHPEYFNLISCSVYRNTEFLTNVKKEFPNVKTCVSSIDGPNKINDLINDPNVDMVINCIAGLDGLNPSITAIKNDKILCIANKETIILGGDALIKLLSEHPKSYLVPLDSEHSSLFQLLLGENFQNVERLIITASGGPFIDYSEDKLKKVKLCDAIKHPTWNMGTKISVDSATMFNKGLEIIEVHYLFGVSYDKIGVVIDRSSKAHALIEFKDGSIKTLMCNPSMKQPISFGISGGQRLNNDIDFIDVSNLNIKFEPLDLNKFKAVDLAFKVGRKGGSSPIIYCVANELAVNAFIQDKILFTDIYDIVEESINTISVLQDYSLNDINKIIDDVKNAVRLIIERRTK